MKEKLVVCYVESLIFFPGPPATRLFITSFILRHTVPTSFNVMSRQAIVIHVIVVVGTVLRF